MLRGVVPRFRIARGAGVCRRANDSRLASAFVERLSRRSVVSGALKTIR